MRYFLIAGEASGDLHGAALMKKIKDVDPNAEFCFLGGDCMQKQGGEFVQHYRNMAFMGIVNVIFNIRKVVGNFKLCTAAIENFKPDVIILIDYPGFNLRIAKYVKSKLNIPIYYYIAPKLWAWKEYRIKTIKRYVDKMFVIFPFETQYFGNLGYHVDYVGNPIVESVKEFLEQYSKDSNEMVVKTSKPTIALLCGSRRQEIAKCLPVMVNMADYFTDFHFVIAAAPNIEESVYRQFLHKDIDIIYGNTYRVLKEAHAAVVNSGTATLETALIGTPQVVVYHVIGGKTVPVLRRLLIKIPFVSLVNLVGEKEIVKELITPYFTENNLREELAKIVYDSENINKIREGYNIVKNRLGSMSASINTAKKICELSQSNVKSG